MKQCCPNCGEVYDIISKGRIHREIKPLPIGKKEVILSLHLHRIHCKRCVKTQLEELHVSPPYRHWSYSLSRYVIDLLKFSTIKDVAEHLNLSWNTVKDIHYQYAVKKGHDYVTIVVDLDRGQVVWVGEGRIADSLRPFLIRLQKAHVPIKSVTMDMWSVSYSAIVQYTPCAKAVFDRYHIMADLNRKLDKLRCIAASQAMIVEKQAYKGVRYLLLKGQEKIVDNKDAKEILNNLFLLNKTLRTAYILKEELRDLWTCENRKKVTKYINNWLEKVYASGINQLMKFAKTVKGHLSGILNYFAELSNFKLHPFTIAINVLDFFPFQSAATQLVNCVSIYPKLKHGSNDLWLRSLRPFSISSAEWASLRDQKSEHVFCDMIFLIPRFTEF